MVKSAGINSDVKSYFLGCFFKADKEGGFVSIRASGDYKIGHNLRI